MNSPQNFSSIEELKKFFRGKIKDLHPDKGGDPHLFREFLDWYQKSLTKLSKKCYPKILDKNSFITPKGNFIYKIEDFTIKEVALVLTKEVMLPLFEIPCPTCKGRGLIRGDKGERCSLCKGEGYIRFKKGNAEEYLELKCPRCEGEGFINKEKCPTCLGKGKLQEEMQVKINLPPGIRDGDLLYIPGETFSTSWDFYIEVNLLPDPHFTLEKDKLIYELKIPFTEVLLKESIFVETLEGKEEVPTSLIKRGEPIIFSGRGPFLLKNGYWKRGDLIVKVNILFPEKISAKAKRLLEKFIKEMEAEENGRKNTLTT